MTPLVKDFSALLSDVDALPSPFASTKTIALESLECVLEMIFLGRNVGANYTILSRKG